MRVQSSLISWTLLCVAPAVSAENWTEFRGPTGQGHSSAKGLPTRWSQERNVAWKQPVPGKGWSSPIVHDGRIFLTTAVASGGGGTGDQSLRALCLDAGTGETKWDVEVFQQKAGARIHNKNSHASPTPLTDGAHVYVHFGTNGTACLDLAGKIVWRNRRLRYNPVHGSGGSPAIAGDLLVLSCDGSKDPFVVALDRKSGKIRWRQARPSSSGKLFAFSTPLVIEVDGKKQVISAGANFVVSYDPKDGSEIWRAKYDGGYSVVPRPVFGQGLVFVCTGYDSPSLLAIRPDGRGDVTRSHVAWTLRSSVPHNPSLLLIHDALFLINDGGIASCLDSKTGKRHWRNRLGGKYSSSPVHADGKIYFQSEDGVGMVIRAAKRFERIARNPLGERSLASYAIADGAIFIRTAENLYRIEEK